jgi:MFS family permease
MLRWLKPHDKINDADVQRGLNMLVFDGVCSQIMGVLTGGAFLVQFALLIGASNAVIGLLAAVGPLTQILQIPTIYLVDGTRLRKAMTVSTAGLGRLFLLLVAALPWFAPSSWQVPLFLFGLFMYYGLGAVAGCAWNSWIRDLVPQSIMGTYFAKRLSIATAIGAGVTLVAGVGVDFYKAHYSNELAGYSVIFLIGIMAGLIGLTFLSLTPEPRMAPCKSTGMLQVLAEPFKDENFRRLLLFMGLWNFAINLAAPFFTVYLLKRLGMSMTVVILLSVLSQGCNVLFFSVWGRLSDKFTNKPVLGVSGFLFILSIIIWPFTNLPNSYFLTIPLVILIHILAGISTAGVAISGGNIALKLAPYGRATSYLAVNGLVCGAAATVAPLVAGLTADWFETQQAKVTLTWISGAKAFNFPAIHLEGLDFLFVAAFVFGFYALHFLIPVKEQGEVEEDLVMNELIAEMRQKVKHVSSAAGLRYLTFFPYQRLKDMLRCLVPNGKAEESNPAHPPT